MFIERCWTFLLQIPVSSSPYSAACLLMILASELLWYSRVNWFQECFPCRKDAVVEIIKHLVTSWQNILAAKAPSLSWNVTSYKRWLTYSSLDEELTFIHPDDVELYHAWDGRAFELQVANHELLGHGSGKLFEEYADGSKNFDPSKVDFCLAVVCLKVDERFPKVIDPLTGKSMSVATS